MSNDSNSSFYILQRSGSHHDTSVVRDFVDVVLNIREFSKGDGDDNGNDTTP
jgi:hypothetical protein